MAVFACTLKRNQRGCKKGCTLKCCLVFRFRVQNSMEKAEAHFASTLMTFPFRNSNRMLLFLFTVPFSTISDQI